jgi:Cu+-exporting ATPase
MIESEVSVDSKCYHCGETSDSPVYHQDKVFCCFGCKTVYEILHSNELCEYYSLDKSPGTRQKDGQTNDYAYLENQEIRKKLLQFDSAELSRVLFAVPAIHCVSCIWLLENLQRLSKGILKSEVNFARKTVLIDLSTSAAPSLQAAIASTPDPVPTSQTRVPATDSCCNSDRQSRVDA